MNVEKIAEYVRSGIKATDSIGVEIEHFIVDENNKSVSFYGKNGVGELFSRLSEFFETKVYSEKQLIGLSNGRFHLTLEPAAQLEVSVEPCSGINEIKMLYEEFLGRVKPFLDEYGYKLVTLGYNPSSKINELDLIPKKRYEFMDKYFEASGKYGKNMMRGTASAQVSIDYSSEADCILKLQLANALSPLFAMITDNSPVFEGEKYNGRMIRTKIWSSVDNARCGIISGSMNKDFSFEKYAEYILNTPAIFVDENTFYADGKTFGEIYSGYEMSVKEIEHALSMIFPDVRLKKYIEIRPADSMPFEYVLSYAALVKGIFMSASEVYGYINTDKISEADIADAKSELIKNGFDAVVYGKKATEILSFLIDTAEKSLDESDSIYLDEMKKIISSKTTLKEGFCNA